jgi:Raf kinase inhibitor-like YbhB/YbcL family protein
MPILRVSLFVLLSLLWTACTPVISTPESALPSFSPTSPVLATEPAITTPEPTLSPFLLTSPAFAAGAVIPERYTCRGENVSPPLSWSNPPAGTQSLVLIMDDPDAPLGTWVHWVVYYIPANVRALEENIQNGHRYDDVALAFGKNSWGEAAYSGPCPPSGTHHYVFRLYALDIVPDLTEMAERKVVEAAVQGHVLGYSELIGIFSH